MLVLYNSTFHTIRSYCASVQSSKTGSWSWGHQITWTSASECLAQSTLQHNEKQNTKIVITDDQWWSIKILDTNLEATDEYYTKLQTKISFQHFIFYRPKKLQDCDIIFKVNGWQHSMVRKVAVAVVHGGICPCKFTATVLQCQWSRKIVRVAVTGWPTYHWYL